MIHILLREVPGLIPDGFIYLRADPSTCLRRLNLRGRKEESSVPEDYLAVSNLQLCACSFQIAITQILADSRLGNTRYYLGSFFEFWEPE